MLTNINFSVYKFQITFQEITFFGFKERFEFFIYFMQYLDKVIKNSLPCNCYDCKDCPSLNKSDEMCDYLLIIGKDNIKKKYTRYSDLNTLFLILPQLTDRELFARGDHFEFTLTLIGTANKAFFIPKYFAGAFEAMGRFTGIGLGRKTFEGELGLGRYELTRIFVSNKEDNFTEIYNQQRGFSRINPKVYNINNLPVYNINNSTLNIGWRTPLSGKELPMNFEIFFKLILSRLNYLNGSEDKNRQCELIEMSKNISLENIKNNHNKLNISLTYKGNLSPFIDYIIMGSCLNIGKKTSYGYGSYFLF